LTQHVTTDKAEWLRARKALLEKEKAWSRHGDELAAMRRDLPKLKLTEDYTFDASSGPVTLSDLFENRSQLIVQHFMFGPGATAGCPICSFWADGYDPLIVHLNQRDISMVVASRGPIEALETYRQKMGWHFTWVSSLNNSFNFDFGVSASPDDIEAGRMNYNYAEIPVQQKELPGASVFERGDDGAIYHTYSTYGRGLESFNAAYSLIDMTPHGRQESNLPFPLAWVRRREEY
jgi:predicted dithiol-disulfide oxidoreductase (DUF899 family)